MKAMGFIRGLLLAFGLLRGSFRPVMPTRLSPPAVPSGRNCSNSGRQHLTLSVCRC